MAEWLRRLTRRLFLAVTSISSLFNTTSLTSRLFNTTSSISRFFIATRYIKFLRERRFESYRCRSFVLFFLVQGELYRPRWRTIHCTADQRWREWLGVDQISVRLITKSERDEIDEYSIWTSEGSPKANYQETHVNEASSFCLICSARWTWSVIKQPKLLEHCA